MTSSPTAKPSDKALMRWWDEQPEGMYACDECGRVDIKSYVQPQHPYYAQGREGVALCGDCMNGHIFERRAARKLQLAAMPRCEVDGCKARATLITIGRLGLCGRHFRRAEARLSGFGIFGMAFDLNREAVLSLAGGKSDG